MFDNDEVMALEFGKFKYPTWKDFFQGAKDGAYYWSEELQLPSMTYEQDVKVNKIRDGILKLKGGHAADKKLFNQIRAEN